MAGKKLSWNCILLASLLKLLVVLEEVKGYQNGLINNNNDPYRHLQVMDPKGKYVLEWQVDFQQKQITFNVTVQTKGYVGFGLSKKAVMDKADIVIGGVQANGQPYFSDRHGKGHEVPTVDPSQDYTLLDARESNSHTFLSFSRPLETCDTTNDIAITDDEVLAVIWAYGERDDELEYHHQNRGYEYLYLLDPDLTPLEIREQRYRNVTTQTEIELEEGDWKIWRIKETFVLPEQDTVYWCTMIKAPTSQRKQHIVGFRPIFHELERRHIHHFVVHSCYTPEGVDPDGLFGPYLERSGEECYVLWQPTTDYPTQYCMEFKHEWAVGGESFFLPEHIGLPFTTTPNEYYMLQVHYDNPNLLPNVRLEFNLEVFYTSTLRQHDAGMMTVGLRPDGATMIVPPFERNHVIYGHCASDCTSKMYPNGVNVFATRLHTHLAGTGARLISIHNKQEIPLSIDDNFHFDYQAFRILRKEVRIAPGDMAYSRCLYSTPNREKVTIGGYATRDEMCHGFYWYYPYNTDRYSLCTSEIRSDVYRDFMQIHNVTWSNAVREHIVTDPPQNSGLKVSDALSRLNWNIDKRTELQTHQRFLPQITFCFALGPDSTFISFVNSLRQGQLAGQSPAAQLSLSVQPQVSSLRRTFINTIQTVRTFTDLDKEIVVPGNEFVYLWPEGLISYKRASTCPATT